MGKPSAPAPPDPKQTSAAQTGTSVATAIANSNLNNVNQITPNGNLTFNQSGSYTMHDPYTGQDYSLPQFTATQTLSPDQQKLYDLNNQTQQNLGQIGVDQSAKIGSLLGTNVDLNNDAVEGRLFDLGSKRLDPQFARDEDALRTRLSNQGLRPGSQAWDAEMTKFQQGKTDAYDQLLLNGRGQSVQEILTERNQPLNEISALLSGSQVSQPNFINKQMPTIPVTDNAGIINTNYNQQFQNYQSQMQNYNQVMGGLFGLGSAGIFKFSDRRLKSDIIEIGRAHNGLPIYFYRIDGKPEIGVMADEVERVKPGAVVTMPNGYQAVDYARALEAA
jgi:hypothetical protein